jgi:5'-3' exonuclease
VLENRSQGLPVVQAPGEAEALCGALNAAGLVDGVATVDGDAFLFGASMVFKELSLSAANPKTCSIARLAGRQLTEDLCSPSVLMYTRETMGREAEASRLIRLQM